MRRDALKRDARDKLMRGMQHAISAIEDVNGNVYNMELRNEMIEQFRRVELFFGYSARKWSPFESKAGN